MYKTFLHTFINFNYFSLVIAFFFPSFDDHGVILLVVRKFHSKINKRKKQNQNTNHFMCSFSGNVFYAGDKIKKKKGKKKNYDLNGCKIKVIIMLYFEK